MSQDTMMQAVRVHAYGGAEQLVLERVARPAPGPQSVLVRVHAAGVNPVDWKIRQGWLQEYIPLQLPYIPGIDLAGVVEEASPGVTEFSPGEAVYGAAMGGSYAEYAIAAPATLAPKPESISFEEAAAVPLGAATAWQAIFDSGGLTAGQRILIHGAAGGVGSLAVQFACWKGAEVLATCSAANVDFVRALGARTVVDYQSTRFEDVVRDVDVVLDAVGGDVQERSWQTLCPGGILVSLVAPPSPEKAAQHSVRATMMGARQSSALLRQVGQLIDAGLVKPTVGHTFRLAEARQAHELSQVVHGRGRIVLQVAGE